MARNRTRLIVASSEASADQLYATRFFVPDAFVYLEKGKRSRILLSDLEVDRGRASAQVDAVDAYSDFEAPLKKKRAGERPAFDEVLIAYLRKQRVQRAEVPGDFPFGLACQLQAAGIRLDPADGFFFPARETKTEAEQGQIRQALVMTAEALKRGFEVLHEAEVLKNRRLRWRGKPLTSEILRAEIDTVCLRMGGLPANTIVAGGEQACDPHERGSGPLRAGELIILDCFPRQAANGYYGDLTRTVIKGRASEAQRELWETVGRGQKLAFQSMKPRVNGGKVHERVQQFFTDAGYPTEQKAGRWSGFFHGTGHGLGLELHEAPRFAATTFKSGQVLTVEPGLYYPGLGGVRTEDVAVVTAKGAQWLSKLADPLEIE